MIKGIRKNTVFVKLPKDKYFECAYFIIRADTDRDAPEEDMVREANRIIETSDLPILKKGSNRQRSKRWAWEPFVVGAIIGMLLVVLVWLATLVF